MFGGVLSIVLEDFYQQLYDGNSEVCFLGIAFRKALRRRRRAGEVTCTPELAMSWVNEVEMAGFIGLRLR